MLKCPAKFESLMLTHESGLSHHETATCTEGLGPSGGAKALDWRLRSGWLQGIALTHSRAAEPAAIFSYFRRNYCFSSE